MASKKSKYSRKKDDRETKKFGKEKKSGVGKGLTGREVAGTGAKRYNPSGKFKRELQVIGDSLFQMGFAYVKDKSQHHKFKHLTCRFCQTSFGMTPSYHRVIKNIVSTIKKMCQTQCVPPIPLDKIPAQLFSVKMAGLIETENEPTILDVLNEITKSVKLSAQVGRESREELRRIADRKGITLGDLIEEMMEVYQKTQ